MARKLDHIESSRVRYLEKSRLLADRIAKTAINLAREKSQTMDCLNSACDYVRNSKSNLFANEPLIIVEPKPMVVNEKMIVLEHPSKRRDVETEVALSKLARNANVDVAISTSTAVAGIESQSNIADPEHKTEMKSQQSSTDDYESKMIMDMAMKEAADMIRKLDYETRSGRGNREDPIFEKHILGLAIELMNKVTAGTTGDRLDVFGSSLYDNVDDYLKSSIDDDKIEADYVSNAGFDYASTRRHLFDGPHGVDDYVGYSSPFSRGRCDTCAKYDMTLGNKCPTCKRNGHMFQGRIKRNNARIENGKIYHLEQLPQVQKKVNNDFLTAFYGDWIFIIFDF